MKKIITAIKKVVDLYAEFRAESAKRRINNWY